MRVPPVYSSDGCVRARASWTSRGPAPRLPIRSDERSEPEFEALDDAGLIAKTEELKKRIADGEKLDALLPEAFANCREGA